MAAERPRMDCDQNYRQHHARSDSEPRHLRPGEVLATADQCAARQEGGLFDEPAIALSHRTQFAAVLMNSAENAEHRERAEKNHIAEPSVHKQVREAENRKRHEARMTRQL